MENVTEPPIGDSSMEEISVNVDNKVSAGQSKKILTVGNQWNVKALLDARTHDDGEVVLCKATKKELFYKKASGTMVMLSAFGKCYTCGDFFHDTHLWQPEGVDKVSWPVEYDGRDCKVCHGKN